MKLVNIKEIKGSIRLKTGLHIGAGDTEMHIGGTDNPVVKNPHTLEPYIPGSSLKGKIRSLLELKSGLMAKTDGAPLSPDRLKGISGTEAQEGENILYLFGTSGSQKSDDKFGFARASFSDCNLNMNSRETCLANQLPLTEIKSENSINRIKGTAENPRFTERVVSGLQFDFSISLKVVEGDPDLQTTLLQGMKLLELDALGGSGSRGYGKVEFEFDDSDIQQKFSQTAVFN
ncbi:MAG: type III-A CRISPR-associated RAMP protein Csm3 [Deltaproteobacteria bacterium]|nr:type III-A CRISPR-associated RAMP protein Csm3 [Deltaproteobacteria bacterium]